MTHSRNPNEYVSVLFRQVSVKNFSFHDCEALPRSTKLMRNYYFVTADLIS